MKEIKFPILDWNIRLKVRMSRLWYQRLEISVLYSSIELQTPSQLMFEEELKYDTFSMIQLMAVIISTGFSLTGIRTFKHFRF